MSFPDFIHHGGRSGVTGSCHELVVSSDASLLVDCGLFQGEDEAADSFEQLQVRFDLTRVKALVVTHVHIDHIGRLPYLLAATPPMPTKKTCLTSSNACATGPNKYAWFMDNKKPEKR